MFFKSSCCNQFFKCKTQVNHMIPLCSGFSSMIPKQPLSQAVPPGAAANKLNSLLIIRPHSFKCREGIFHRYIVFVFTISFMFTPYVPSCEWHERFKTSTLHVNESLCFAFLWITFPKYEDVSLGRLCRYQSQELCSFLVSTSILVFSSCVIILFKLWWRGDRCFGMNRSFSHVPHRQQARGA